MEAKKLQHCIFIWRVENISLCDRRVDKKIVSPTFKVRDSPIKWELELQPKADANDVWFLSLKCKPDEGGKSVPFNQLFVSYSGDIWFQEGDQHFFRRRWRRELPKTRKDELHPLSIKNFVYQDYEIYACEFLFCEDINKSDPSKEVKVSSEKSIKSDIDLLSEDMKNLYYSQRFCDISLRVKGGIINAHKAILSARSPFFEKLFKYAGEKVVEFPDIKLKMMDKLMCFIYSGNSAALISDGPPPVGLYEYAKKFVISDLQWFLNPQKIYTHTNIKTEACDYTWLIKNFSSYRNDISEFIESPLIKPDLPSSLEWKIRLHPKGSSEHEEYIGLSVEVKDQRITKTNPYQIMIYISFLDAEGQLCFTRQMLRTMEAPGICSFGSFIHRETLDQNKSNLLARDTLAVHCNLKFSTGEYVSKIERISEMPDPNTESRSYLSDDLRSLYEESTFSDATLIVEKTEFSVHRAVLSARSPVFASMFEHDMKEKQSGKVIMKDIHPDVLELMLEYMYFGKLGELSADTALGLYRASEQYGLRRLKNKCSDFLQCHLQIESACETLVIADLYSDKELKKSAEYFICSNADAIFNSESWKDLVAGNSDLIVEVMKILTKSFRRFSESLVTKK